MVDFLLDSIKDSAHLKQLSEVWVEIGMTDTQRRERRERIVLHVSDLLQEMSSEELNLKLKLEESLESNSVELEKLCKQLSVENETVVSL